MSDNDLDRLDNVEFKESKPISDDDLKRRMGARLVIRDEMVPLSELDYALKKLLVGASWEIPGADLTGLDLDFSLFLLNKDDQTREDGDFVFYNNPSTMESAVTHTGDDRTGAGDGDNERFFINLEALPYEIVKIVFVISVYEPDIRDHSLTMLKNTFIRLINQETNVELLRYNLVEDFDNKLEAAVTVGELIREGPVWLFKAKSDRIEGGLGKIATGYGMKITG